VPKFRWESQFKETQIGKIPQQWELLTLEKCTEAIIDYRGKTPRKSSFGIPLITAKIVKNGQILEPEEFIPSEDYSSWMRRGVPYPGDVIITTEAPLGEVAQLDERKVALAQRIIALRGKSGLLENNYLKFALQSPAIQHELMRRATGTTVIGIKQKELRNVPIPIPPLSEQKFISNVLLLFEKKIELCYHMSRILEKIAIAFFKNWFIDFEPFKDNAFAHTEVEGVPKDWEVKKLATVFNLVKGKRCELSEEYVDGYKPYLLIETYTTGNVTHWTNEKQPLADRLDIVLVADGESSGKVLRFQSGIVGSTLLMLKPRFNSPDLRHFAYLFLKNVEEELMAHRTGSAIPHLDKDYLANIEISLPPTPIIQKFNSIVDPLFQKIILNQNQIILLRKIRDALLPLLVFGKLRVGEI
jgi:type I restriction enzyme S subunit